MKMFFNDFKRHMHLQKINYSYLTKLTTILNSFLSPEQKRSGKRLHDQKYNRLFACLFLIKTKQKNPTKPQTNKPTPTTPPTPKPQTKKPTWMIRNLKLNQLIQANSKLNIMTCTHQMCKQTYNTPVLSQYKNYLLRINKA